MATWATIRTIALSLPEAEEEPGERPAFRVRGKLFAWRSRDRDGATLALRVDRDEKQLMLDASPDLYFQTPHYEGYPGVLVHLDAIDVDELRERIEDAWLIQAAEERLRERLPRRSSLLRCRAETADRADTVRTPPSVTASPARRLRRASRRRH